MDSDLGQKVYLFKYDYFKYDHDIIKIFERQDMNEIFFINADEWIKCLLCKALGWNGNTDKTLIAPT